MLDNKTLEYLNDALKYYLKYKNNPEQALDKKMFSLGQYLEIRQTSKREKYEE